ncbi:DNA mismatch repair protein MutL [Marinitoga hydrogenitolerans DSM 16785]|uniref:DNA mismatch repair protein MutL n=1 Tax=Marinitoga hydrogenitolerans (strain DSM 16785 / JCM 12826 / AT1271) TaxID=1122195 RepID=A0A1M4WV56_MARH1|nr:DNA mismatch repair endonuclease MutL [Marinitoga hydrogenitolerans]SHE85124.1 DNA mismatch repair protein MutL [Marinitoga hydrogenitolerans DSM 16785]
MAIVKLPESVIMKIAAGEVVTGTFAVVKELFENAIDAHADKITVEIKDGGKTYIRITDNGVGMSEEEILLAVQPHTTSKIKDVNDLYNIHTYGFRGEALAAISRVSRMKITSKRKDDDVATSIEFVGSKPISTKKTAAQNGTTIEVKDLFFNIPARRKFLKSAAIEGRMITEIIEKFILATNVGIDYIKDGKLIYSISKNIPLIEKINTIFPETKKDDFFELNIEESWFKIKGFISHPRVTRNNRTAQIFFINNRYIRSGDLFAVFESGYGEMLESRRHPYGIVFFEIDPKEVDINVHPQKLEVKISESRIIYNKFKRLIRETLINKTTFRMSINVEDASDDTYTTKKVIQKTYENSIPTVSELEEKYETFLINKERKSERIEKKPLPIMQKKLHQKQEEKKIIQDINQNINYLKSQHVNPENTIEKKSIDFSYYKIVGLVADRYIILELKDSIHFIDFHAAHERVIYEDLKKIFFEKGNITTQMIMLPIKLNLDETRKEILENNIEKIRKLGFEITEENNEFYIIGFPSNIKINDPQTTIIEILDELRLEGIESPEKIFDHAIATMACRAAVKTGDDPVGLDILISKIIEYNILTCPHGRPISMELQLKKLDEFFERS